MKRVILLTVILILLATPILATDTYVIGAGKTEKAVINIINYDPLPASAGEHVTIYLKVRNQDSSDIKDIKLTLIEDYPFSFDVDTPTRNIKNLRKDEIALLTYKVRVADDATEGENILRFKYETPQGFWFSEDVKIDVKSEGGALGIESVISTPERVAPGQTINLKVNLKNNANSYVRDVVINLDVSSIETFTPVGSTTEKRITGLGAGQTKELQYDLIVDPSAETKAYRIPLTVTYTESSAAEETSNHIVGVVVDSEADYQLDIEDTEVHTKGDVGKVTVSVSNVGTSELKFLTLELKENKNYEIISNQRVYLGNLEPDDFKTAEYKIQSGSSKDVKLDFDVIYKDSYNKPFTDNKDVNLKMFSARQAVAYGLSQPNGGIFNIFIYLIVLFFIFKTYKQWKIDRDIEVAVKKVAKRWYRWCKEKIKLINKKNIKKFLKKIKLKR